jgi:hypothetical protein
VTRLKQRYAWETPRSALFTLLLLEFGDFPMMRRVLKGIKKRAEAMRLHRRSGPRTVGVHLYWLPPGGGGWFVRLNGRLYERMRAWIEHRQPLDLYHTALVVTVPDDQFEIENCWPIPNAQGPARGVTVEGPVWSPHLGRFGVFRYEVRRWLNGYIADATEAVDSPRCVSPNQDNARRILELTESAPAYVWGRDRWGTGTCGTPLGHLVVAYQCRFVGVGDGTTSQRQSTPGWTQASRSRRAAIFHESTRGDGPASL